MKRKIARQFNSSNHRFERYIDLDASIDAACQCRMHTLELDSFDILCETGNAPPTFFFVCLEFAKKCDSLMAERPHTIVCLVPRTALRMWSRATLNTTCLLILNFSSDQKYFSILLPFFSALAFAIIYHQLHLLLVFIFLYF